MVDRLVNSEANNRRIGRIESCFGGAGQSLQVPGRVLVGEGVLTKTCRKKPKPRQFFLFNDLLVYGTIIINNKKFNKQRIIPLEEVKVKPMEDNGQIKNSWLICARGKSFAVSIGTTEEKEEWMAHINWCIEDVLRKSGKMPSSDHAAVWVPDAQVNTCMSCNMTQFSMVHRRHHCRHCGKVVCANCSDRSFMLPALSSKPSRVCVSCYGELERSGRGVSVGEEMAKEESVTDSSGEDDSTDEDNNSEFETIRPSFYGSLRE